MIGSPSPPVPAPIPDAPSLRVRWLGAHDSRMWMLFVGRLTNSIGHGISFPFLAIYFTSRLGVSPWIAGAISSAGALAGAASKYLGGALSDRLGRRAVLLAALAGRTLTTFGIAVLAAGSSPWWVPLALLFVLGSAFGWLFEPASQAMVADIATARSRLAGYGLLRVGGNLGWGMGAFAGGFIGSASYAAMFLTTAIVLSIAFVFVRTLVTETRSRPATASASTDSSGAPRSPAMRLGLDSPGFLLLCGVGVLIHVVVGQFGMPLSVYGKSALGIPENRIGLLYSVNAALVVILQFPVSRWFEGRFRLTTTLVLGSALFGAGYGAIGLAHGFAPLVLCVVVFTLGEILVIPGTIALAANLAPEHARGRYLGAFGLAANLGRCLGPLLGGFNLDFFRSTPWVHWAEVAALAFAASFVFLALRRRVAREADLGT